jgi:adhesin/invasin
MKRIIFILLALILSASLFGCGSGGGDSLPVSGTDPNSPVITPGTDPGTDPVIDPGTATVGSVTLAFQGGGQTKSLVASGTATAVVKATVHDTGGLPLAGKAVSFLFSSGSGTFTPDNTAVTDASGIAAITLQSSTILGDSIFFATADTVDSNLITASFIPGTAAQVTLSANPTTVGPAGTTDIFASVEDAYAHVLSGVTVNFTSDGNSAGTSSTAFEPTPFSTTNANGLATIAYRAGNAAATDTITVNAGGITDTIAITVSATASVVSNLSVSLNPATVPADGISSVTVTATVKDATGGNAQSVPVDFSLSSASLGAITTVIGDTNVAGNAFANFTAGTTAGVVTVIVKAGGFTKTVPLTLTAAQAASLTLSANPSTITVGGQAQLEATVLDASSNPVPGETVEFSREFGGSNSSDATDMTATTDARGKAKIIYTAGSTPGSDTFRAALPGVANVTEKTAVVTVTSDDTQIESINIVEVLPGDLLSTGTLGQLIVEALGSGGIPLQGVTLVGLASGSAVISGPAPALTDNFGRTTFTVSDTAEETIEVRITGGAAVAKQVLNFGPPIDLTLATTPSQVVADGVSTISITATVAGASGGIPVKFKLTNTLGALSQSSVTTVNGKATTTFTAGTVAGATTVIAEASGFAKSLTLTLTPGPATTLTLSAAPTPLLAGNTAQIIATITDESGNPIQGESVTITLDSNGSGSVFTTGSATTDGRGIAKVPYTAGTIPGADIFTATPSNAGVNTGTVTVTVQADSADITSIVIDTIDPGILLNTSGSADVTVTVSGAGGLLEGVTLNAAATGSAVADPGAPVTDKFGQAIITITDTVAENVVLRISGGAKAVEQTFHFGPTLTLTPANVSAIGEATLTAVLRDANGVPMPGFGVNFITSFPVSSDADNIVTKISGLTDGSGIATATVTDTAVNAGSVTVTATDDKDQVSSAPALVTFKTEADAFDLTAEISLPVVTPTGTTTITATVTDRADGLPAAGQPVTFETTGSATLSAASGNTTSTGEVSVDLEGTVAETVVVTISSGLNVVKIPVYFGAGIQLNPAISESIADGTVEAPLTATVFDANGAVIPGIPVYFSVTKGSALLSSGEVVTNDLGKAAVTVTDSVIESDATISATAGDLTAVTAVIDFQSGAPANLVLVSTPVNTDPLVLFGAADITATVTDALGNFVADNTPVTFLVSGTASAAKITVEATTSDGVATAKLSGGNISGSLTVTATAGDIIKTLSFTVTPSDAGSIEVLSVDPEFVQLQGQSGTQTSTITFMVKDPGGNAVADGTAVDVELDPTQLGGGELISDGSTAYATSLTTQTVAGQASVTFRSGIVSGTVDITATVATTLGGDIRTVAQVTVLSGQPDYLHLFTSGSPINVPSLIYDGCTSAYNITVGDRYGNPVPDGTNVSFMVEPSCGLIGSSNGFMTTTDKGKISEEMAHATNEDFGTLPLSEQPKCTVVAYMNGDESFNDLNGNGRWDAAEPCPGDRGEPYVDANDDGIYNAGELYVDVDQSGTYDGPNATCDTDTVLWKEFRYLASGFIDTFDVSPTTFALDVGSSQTFTVTVSDANGAPPIAGTTLSVSSDGGTLLNGGDSIIGDTSEASPWTRSFTLMSDIDPTAEPKLVIISVGLTFPGGACGDNGSNLSTQIAGVINQAPAVPAVAPTVSFTVPDGAATFVALDSQVTIFFSEPMNLLTINGANVTATCTLAGSFNLGPATASSGDQAFTFKPATPFTAGDTCTVTVSSSVRDVNDDLTMGAPAYTFSFTTAP